LVAVWDDDLALGHAGAEEFGVPFTNDLDALLARDDIDGVTITTPTSAHHDVMVKAANAGGVRRCSNEDDRHRPPELVCNSGR
jgi:predicted dehydrogenase